MDSPRVTSTTRSLALIVVLTALGVVAALGLGVPVIAVAVTVAVAFLGIDWALARGPSRRRPEPAHAPEASETPK